MKLEVGKIYLYTKLSNMAMRVIVPFALGASYDELGIWYISYKEKESLYEHEYNGMVHRKGRISVFNTSDPMNTFYESLKSGNFTLSEISPDDFILETFNINLPVLCNEYAVTDDDTTVRLLVKNVGYSVDSREPVFYIGLTRNVLHPSTIMPVFFNKEGRLIDCGGGFAGNLV